ncbi:MAG: right-handed parallel beta-helix repeat-containing protein [Planctomycetota bacterium]
MEKKKQIILAFLVLLLAIVARVPAELDFLSDDIIAEGNDVSTSHVKIEVYGVRKVDIAWRDTDWFAHYANLVDNGLLVNEVLPVGGYTHHIMGISRDNNWVRIGLNSSKNITEWTRGADGFWVASDTGYDCYEYSNPSGAYDVSPTTSEGGFIFTDVNNYIVHVYEANQDSWSMGVFETNQPSGYGRYSALVYDSNGDKYAAYENGAGTAKLRAGLIPSPVASVNDVASNPLIYYHVALTAAADGTLYLVASLDGNSTNLYISEDGGSWLGPNQIVAKGISGDNTDYAVAVSPNESLIAALVFDTNSNLTLATSNDVGATWVTQTLASGSSHAADLGFDGDGYLYVAYYDSNDDKLHLVSTAPPVAPLLCDSIIATDANLVYSHLKIEAYDTRAVDIAWANGAGYARYSNWVDGELVVDNETITGLTHHIMGISRDSNTIRVGLSNSKDIKEWTRNNSTATWTASDTGYDAVSYAMPIGAYDVDPNTGYGGFVFKDANNDVVYVYETSQDSWNKGVFEVNQAGLTWGQYSALVYDANGKAYAAYKADDTNDALRAGPIPSPVASLNDVTHAEQYYHVNLEIADDGTLYLLDNVSSSQTRLYTSEDGITWSGPNQIIASGRYGDTVDYGIAVSPDESMIATLVYDANLHLLLATSYDSGATWATQWLTAGWHLADIDFDPDGELYVCFFDTSDNKIHLKSTAPVICVDSYGAQGDGNSNDTGPLYRAAKTIEAQDGGTIAFTSGKTYAVGQYKHVDGEYPYYQEYPIIAIDGVAGKVCIRGSGAEIKMRNSLKFGSFDPNTGDVYNPSLPFIDYDYKADAGNIMDIDNCTSVEIWDINLHGNLQNLSLGGYWGDTGRQCSATGIELASNDEVKIYNTQSNYCGMDGILIDYEDLDINDPPTPHYLENVKCLYNARQGISWVGGIGLTVKDSEFSHTGRQTFWSGPAAGLDAEPLGGTVCQDGHFENCKFVNNYGAGIIATDYNEAIGAVRDVNFVDCTIWGTTNYAVWPDRPGFQFVDCNIYGTVANTYGSNNASEATLFSYCWFEDINDANWSSYNGGNALVEGYGQNVMYEGCTIKSHNNRAIYLHDVYGREIVTLCEIHHNYEGIADGGYQSLMWTTDINETDFYEQLDEAKTYYINVWDVNVGANLYVEGPRCRWNTVDGNTGYIDPGHYD